MLAAHVPARGDNIVSWKSFNPALISLTRAVVGLLFACHGAGSLFGLFGGASGKGGTVPTLAWPGWWAAVIQLVGGALVLVGLGTRIAALICSGSMAYAYFTVHAPIGLWPIENKGEAAALFSWTFLLIAVVGPGKYAVDTLLSARSGRELAPEPAGAPVPS